MEREPRFPDVDWYCDRCNAYLNTQIGFDDHKYLWKCTECGFKNSISRDNIRDSNYAIVNGLLSLVEFIRTLCLHSIFIYAIAMTLNMRMLPYFQYMHLIYAAYPVLIVVYLLIMLYGHFHGVGILATIIDMIVGDIFRPYREVLRLGRLVSNIRNQKRLSKKAWSLLVFIGYASIIVGEILLLYKGCIQTWGSLTASFTTLKNWFSNIDNTRSLYPPFMIFVITMTVVTFLAFGVDKYYAVRNKWRVKESTLFTLSILFGACGGFAGMIVFHHKVNKPGFKVLIPILALGEVALVLWTTLNYFF